MIYLFAWRFYMIFDVFYLDSRNSFRGSMMSHTFFLCVCVRESLLNWTWQKPHLSTRMHPPIQLLYLQIFNSISKSEVRINQATSDWVSTWSPFVAQGAGHISLPSRRMTYGPGEKILNHITWPCLGFSKPLAGPGFGLGLTKPDLKKPGPSPYLKIAYFCIKKVLKLIYRM